jgi:hypothetical protein
MIKNEAPLIPITEDRLDHFKDEVTAYLKQVSWRPSGVGSNQRKKTPESIDLSFLIHAGKALNVDETDQLSLLKNAVRISDDRTILTNTTNVVLNAIRRGFCLGKAVASIYEESSGLEHLKQKDKNGDLHQSELPQFHQKLQTQSAVLVYTASNYIQYAIKDHRAEAVDAVKIDFGGIPEVVLTRPSKAIHATMYYFTAYVERSGVVKNDLEFLKMTLVYFKSLSEEIRLRKDSLSDVEFFTNQHYKLENTDFVLKGFEELSFSTASTIAFNATRMEEIVANKEAKHLFKRYAERLLCFDFEQNKNPFLELGGLPAITMADGKPGTGKSMLIAATATLLKERCDQLGYPFLFWPLPENIISTYQGGSAERAMDWFRPMQGTDSIIFAPIDDAENNLEERTRQGVSAGVREFIGVFLRNTEGAYAVNNGNRMISLFTNIPDQIDKAVLSRIQVRIPIDGASEYADFIDQDYLWWKKYHELDTSFIDAKKPKGYEYMEAQKPVEALNSLYQDEYEFTQNAVADIYSKTQKSHDVKSHGFFGAFYEEIQRKYPFFSSRDLRNIQKSVDARLTDFDLPAEWWEHPDRFFLKAYDEKLSLLKQLMKDNLRGLSFSQFRLREALAYIETAIRINETGIQRRIQEAADDMYIRQKASDKLRGDD